MNWMLLRRFFKDSRLLLAACALYALAFSWARVFIVAELDTSQFRQILELLPDSFKTFTPVDFEWLISYVGRVAFNFDEPMLVIAVSIWCIARASEVVSGTLASGTLELLLAQPITRLQHYRSHTAVTLLGVAMICIATWVGMWAGVQTATVEVTAQPELKLPLWKSPIPIPFVPPNKSTHPISDFVNCWVFWPGVVNLFTLGVFLTALTAFFSSWDRYRWRTIGIVSSLYIVMALIKVLSMSIEGLNWTGWLTFFSLYEPELAIAQVEVDPSAAWNWSVWDDKGQWRGWGPLAQNFWLVTLGAFLLLGGERIFAKRDLPAPV